MLSIVVFGAICELEEPDDEYSSVVIDHFNMTRQAAETAGLITSEKDTREERPRRMFEQTHSIYTPDSLTRPVRWWHTRRRRRKKRTAYSLTEFADLSEGRRVIVRSDRGFSESWKHLPSPFYGHSTPQSFANYIRNWFKETEKCPCCEFSPEWILERLQRLYGVEIDPASIQTARQIPLQVELGPRLLEQLQQSP